MKDLYLDCFSGVAGDMLVGALLDLGAPFEEVERGLAGLGVGGYRLERRTVQRHAIAATKFDVHLEGHSGEDPGATEHGGRSHGHDHPHDHDHDHDHDHGHGDPHEHAPRHDARGLREIRALLGASDLPKRVRSRAFAAFELLAKGEAKVHGTTPEEVHFHEVGAVDAICDVVGTAIALECLEVERIFVGPIRAGSGFVRCAHGTMPVPAPGALECLTGFDVRFEEGRGELVTPTGACLVGALGVPRVPRGFVVSRVGYGAGTRDPGDAPNVLRAVLGADAGDPETLLELSTNLDHLAPVQVAAAVEAAFAAGAAEAFTVPCTMKKGRPGLLLVALVSEAARGDVERALFRETGTLGIRRTPVHRTVLDRRFEMVPTPWGDVRVKVGTYAGEETSRVPEFEDCRRRAGEAGVPVAARRACDKERR